MRVIIDTIPHGEQRYATVGDYFTDDNGAMRILVSDLGNDDYIALVAIHELVEYVLVRKRGIAEEAITKFDMAFEEAGHDGEPGDDPNAPYQNEHCIATAVERMICAALNVKWKDYESACDGVMT